MEYRKHKLQLPGGKKHRLWAVIVWLTVMSFPASAQRLVFTPQWTPQSQFAGYYAALELGFYKEAGVDVHIEHPSASNSAVNRLMSGKSDIITLQLVQAMGYIDKGVQLVNILQTSQHSSMMIVSHDNIRSIDGLKGKRVGVWKAGFDEIPRAFDRQHDLHLEWIPFVQNVNLFISGAIDATLATSYNEYFQILATGMTLSEQGIFRFSELGYDIPEDGLYVTRAYYEKYRDALQKFAEASRRGWLWAAKHSDEALRITMKWVHSYQVATNFEHQKWMLREVLRLQRDSLQTAPPFTLRPEALERANRLLLENHIISRDIRPDQIAAP